MPIYRLSDTGVIDIGDEEVIALIATPVAGSYGRWEIWRGEAEAGPPDLILVSPTTVSLVVPLPGGWRVGGKLYVKASGNPLLLTVITRPGGSS